MRSCRCARGFSLLELMVAIGLLGLLSAAVYSFIWTLFDRETRALDLAGRTQSAAILFDRLERDLLTAVASTAEGSGLVGDERSMTVYHRAVLPGSPGAPHADLQMTTVRFEPGAGRLRLDRVGAHPHDDGQAVAPAVFDNEIPDEDDTLMTGVRAVRFRYHDGRAWRRAFDSSEGLPAAVEAALWFGSVSAASETGRAAGGGADDEQRVGIAEWSDFEAWEPGMDELSGWGGMPDEEDGSSTPTGRPDRVRVIAIPDAALPAARGSGGGVP